MNKEQNRRIFLKKIALGTIGLSWMPQVLAASYRPLFERHNPIDPLRVTGRVSDGSKGLRGVSISDGIEVVQTNQEGMFEMISSKERPFVWMSVPSGYQIPKDQNGMAGYYKAMGTSTGQMEATWELEKLPEQDSKHNFIVMADTQILDQEDMHRYHNETIPDVKEVLNNMEGPVFNLACGDIMYDHLELYPGFEKGIAQIGIPSFQVVGNHDLDRGPTDEGSITTFLSRYGPGYYSFNRGEVHYVVLDDVFWFGKGYMGYIDEVQYHWLENDLKFVEKGTRVIVFTHIPVFDRQFQRDGERTPGNGVTVTNRDRLYRILEPYNSHIITGHMHTNDSFSDGGATHHNCGTVCGAWWTGDICYDGTPNGYVLYEVKGSDFSWQYKSTGHPFDHQIRLYEKGADPVAPDEIVANVWDVRPDSQVFWYEDGIRKGKMARRVGLDPESVKLHTGPDKPPKHAWVDPVNTSHLFYAPVSDNVREILVEFMNSEKVYTKKLKA